MSSAITPSDTLRFGAGDSYLLRDVLEESFSNVAFERVREEVAWHEMFHKGGAVPRLIAIQATIEDGSIPLYRHPMDEMPIVVPWTPTILAIKRALEDKLKVSFNHALIQWYRNGLDFISPHADKTLDVTRGSSIINMSLGATRYMQLKPKKNNYSEDTSTASAITEKTIIEEGIPTEPQRVALAHNTAFVLGWDTNLQYVHGIKQDRRELRLRSEDELSYGGHRISITFRSVATWMKPINISRTDPADIFNDSDVSQRLIWGQGSTLKTRPMVVTDFEVESRSESESQLDMEVNDVNETLRLLKAFSAENRLSSFDWDRYYGGGFDVIDLKCEETIENAAGESNS